MEIGLETECAEYSRITFRGCHVVRGGNAACDIQNGDCATVHDITFEDISIELESFYTKEQLQRSAEQVYDKKDVIGLSSLLYITNARFRTIYAFTGIENGDLSDVGKPHYAAVRRIGVKNVNIYADEKILADYGKACVGVTVRNIIPTTAYEDITVENISLNGERIYAEDMTIRMEGCDAKILTVK